MRGSIITLLLCLMAVLSSGCATFNPYEKVAPASISNLASHGQVRLERGQPRPLIDAAGKLIGLPNRIALGNMKVDNHDISQATELEITNYLEQNGLSDVMVRSNQYAPRDEFRRMIANDKIRPIWKMSFGSYNWLKYTLLPGRLTGGDWYNPYSESLHILSLIHI